MSSQGDPEILYHYTTTAGLIGILSNRGIWATDSWFLNDSSEVRYGLGIVRARLNRYSKQADRPEPEQSALKGAMGILELDLSSVMRSLVACFSAHDDQLSQWRAYSGGGGVALGFDGRAYCSRGTDAVPDVPRLTPS